MEVVGWFVGAAIGTAFTALYDGVKTLKGRTTKFKAQLEALELTLESFDPEVIQQIGRHNEALSLPNEDVKALEEKLNEGVRFIGELSDARLWNRMESRYISQLVQLNRSLNVLERKLKMQSIRDVKETRHMMQILLFMTLHQGPCRDGHGHGSLLDIVQQEAPHQILTLDSGRNIASTSTNLRQLHGNGEIQEVGSSSGPRPSPLGSNQPLINGGQLVTTSRNGPYRTVVHKIVLAVHVHSDKCKTKVLKLAASMDGVQKFSIQRDTNYLEVIGAGVDAIALVMLLRKYIGIAMVVEVREEKPAQLEEKPAPSKYVKICKRFKRTMAMFGLFL